MVNFTSFVYTLASLLQQYFPEELDLSLKPIDSADCLECRQIQYDFIIVGAGSAGCVLANRLSANENWKILLIEAGGDEDFVSDVPMLQPKLVNTRFDWNFTTVPQQRACRNMNGSCQYPQGHAMGGSSTLNIVRYIRGNRADFDEWAALGNPGWSYDEILPYFRKSENITIPELMNSYYHSTDGELSVSYSNYDNIFLEAYLQAGHEFGLKTVDYNGIEQAGISYSQNTIRNGTTRCSTSKAFLEPIRYRKNLYIFKNTLVSKILFDKTNQMAIGVQCYKNGAFFNVTTTKEVIITAGGVNTPKLLMLSGIGPRNHLEELGIPVILDLPVGESLQDHVIVPMFFSINDTQSLEMYSQSSYDAILDYAKNRHGILTTPNGMDIVAFFNRNILKKLPPDVEFMSGTLIDLDSGPNITLPTLALAPFKLKPKSIGTVKLKSCDFLESPLIDPNYFGNPEDMEITKWGVTESLKYMAMPSMARHGVKWNTTLAENYCGKIDENNLKDLECYIMFSTQTVYHPVGTCKMGPLSDRSSVVDNLLKVHYIKNLRIAGVPIFPSIIRGHPNPIAIVTGEKLADILMNDYSH